ncbi:MAG: PTS sugar transporter subunit IIA [Candidatus Zixiibacteriota bacterium]|nr:MAG: PTS sugar transporter subunit IIA [candidate division Zixibacteria bacterium]
MKLSKFCDESLVTFDLKSTNKDEVIEELVALAASSNMIKDRDALLADVKEREELVTTGVGHGVAFPHAKTKAAKGIVIVFGRSDDGIDFDAMDQKKVRLFFLIAAPEDAIGAHLNVMAILSYAMKSEENRGKLLQAASPGDVLALVDNVK